MKVNASAQFCGVAEMVGPVDFDKSVDYWQQDKWSGQFPVKWHIIKDVPNSQFRHIVLENNDNKPVTNSRDTQEVNISGSFFFFFCWDVKLDYCVAGCDRISLCRGSQYCVLLGNGLHFVCHSYSKMNPDLYRFQCVIVIATWPKFRSSFKKYSQLLFF